MTKILNVLKDEPGLKSLVSDMQQIVDEAPGMFGQMSQNGVYIVSQPEGQTLCDVLSFTTKLFSLKTTAETIYSQTCEKKLSSAKKRARVESSEEDAR